MSPDTSRRPPRATSVLKSMTEILAGQRLATAGGTWTHIVDTVYSSGSGGELAWLMVNLQVEMVSHGGRSRRVFDSAARMQLVREAGWPLRIKFLQVYTYVPENRARLA